MYRRDAVIEAGLFTEGLTACEDVDLAWRVVLLGYQLSYIPTAKAVHYDCSSWHGFVKKGFRYGRGAGLLASIYAPHGASDKFAPGRLWSTKTERLLSGTYYWAGYKSMGYQLKLKLNPPSCGFHRPSSKDFAPTLHGLQAFRCAFPTRSCSGLGTTKTFP
jgi:GT2 family glycosyltransferase